MARKSTIGANPLDAVVPIKSGGPMRLAMLWLRALADSARNGLAERVRPAASWRRGGNLAVRCPLPSKDAGGRIYQ